MAQFAPHLIRSRRRRMMAAQRACCGIALASFRLNSNGDVDASEGTFLFPVSAAYVADVLEFNSWRRLSESDKRFVNRLALHRDARLRTVAAAIEGALDSETVRKLAKDPAFSVRRELSRNDDALGKLSAEECVQLTQRDSSLIMNVLTTLTRIVDESARALDDEAAELAATLPKVRVDAIEKLRFVIDTFKDHPDRDVRNEAADAEEELKETDNESACIVPAKVMKLRKRREKQRALRESFVGNPGEYAVGFVFLKESALSKGNILPDRESPLFRIPLDAYGEVIRGLPNCDPREVFLERFAANASARVREITAEVECLPKAALDLLKTDDNYDVRLALLQNESALTELSEKDLVALIRGDTGLVHDAFEYSKLGERMRSILETAFEDSDDPNIAELLEALTE